MKKWLSLLLAIVTAFLLVACAPTSSKSDKEDEEESFDFSRGEISKNVYKNELLGFKFTKPGAWTYSSDKEIAELVNLSVDMISSSESFKKALKNAPVVYDMMVVDYETGCNVIVMYENLALTATPKMTVEEYIEVTEANLANVANMTFTFPDTYKTVKLGDTKFTKVEVSTKMDGETMKQVYYLHKVDSYMACIVATVPSSYTVKEIEAMFD